MLTTLILAAALNGPAARAQETASPAPTPKLTKVQEMRLRVRRGWAKLLLAEMNKNDFMIRGLGTGEGVSPQNVLIAVGNTVPAAALIYATKKAFTKDLTRAKAHHAQVRALTGKIRNGLSGMEINSYLVKHKVAPTTEVLTKDLRAITRPGAGKLMLEAGRDLRLLALGAVTAALIYDGVQVWMRVAMSPDSFERRRAELQDFVDQANYTLMQNDAR